MRAVLAEGYALLSNLPSCSCSFAPVPEARHQAVLTVDDPTSINHARIVARYRPHSHCLMLREEREEQSPFIFPCKEYYHRDLISLEGGTEEDLDQ